MSRDVVVSVRELIDRGVLAVSDGYRTKRAEHGQPGFRIIRVADVMDGVVNLTSPDFVSEDYRAQIGSKLGQSGDIILTTKGTVGRVAIMPTAAEPVVYSPQLCFFRIMDPSVLHSRFLRYWFSSPAFHFQASHRMNNTDMAAYINLADIRSLKIALPCLDRQQAITEVLTALDDKIATNTQIIALLRDHLAAELEFSLTASIQSFRLSDVALFHNRKRIPLSARQREERAGNIPYYGASGIFGRVDEALFNEQVVLVGEDGSVVTKHGTPVIQYIWGPAWVNNHAHVLTGTSISTELLYFAVARKNVSSLVTGAVQPKISMGNLKSLVLDLPHGAMLSRLESLVASEMGMLRTLREETELLANTRDVLLPQLMSGKIRVKDAEKTVEEVL